MDLIGKPLGLNGEFLPESVDKSLADITEWSDIVRKYSYGNVHYFLTLNILNGCLRILLCPHSVCSTPFQKAPKLIIRFPVFMSIIFNGPAGGLQSISSSLYKTIAIIWESY